MSPAFLITGTDTGVGKTYISLLVLEGLQRRGIFPGVMKPVETGCLRAGETLRPQDAEMLRVAARVEDPLDLVNPCRYEAPLAPLEAARREGAAVDLGVLRRAFDHLRHRHSLLLVEGAGGLLVPLAGTYTFADLARDWGLPLLLVVGSRLGAINQALLTLEVSRHRGLKVLGVILNHPQPPDHAAASNAELLPRLIPEPVLGVVGHEERQAGLNLAPVLELGK